MNTKGRVKTKVIAFLAIASMLHVACHENTKATQAQPPLGDEINDNIGEFKFKSAIRCVFQDSKGNYWLGSDQEGVCKYNGKTFTYYTLEDGLCGAQVISIGEDETGKMWFETGSGVCSFDGTSFEPVNDDQQFMKSAWEEKQNTSWGVTPNDLWFAGNAHFELLRIDHGKASVVNYPKHSGVITSNSDITAIAKSKRGGLWIAHYESVVYYDGQTTEYINDSTEHFDGRNQYMHVRSILEDSKGRLWIGNNGMGVLLKEGNVIRYFSKEQGLVRGEAFKVTSPEGTLMHVFAIAEDRQGNIWFGDRDTGAWKYDGQTMTHYTVDSAITKPMVCDIYVDRNGQLLLGMAAGGVYRFNGENFERKF